MARGSEVLGYVAGSGADKRRDMVSRVLSLYCLFCGRVMACQDTSIRKGDGVEVTCAGCYAVFWLQERNQCLKTVRVEKCGKECTC